MEQKTPRSARLVPCVRRIIQELAAEQRLSLDESRLEEVILLRLNKYQTESLGDMHLARLIRKIAQRLQIDEYRSQARGRDNALRAVQASQGHRREETPYAPEVLGHLEDVFADLLLQIPPTERTALTLRVVHGESMVTIASKLGVSRSTLQRRVSGALQYLQKLLAQRAKDDVILRDALESRGLIE